MESVSIAGNKGKVIEITRLNKSFGDLKVLNDVDIDLFTGENLVVLGRSGSGKSVLIKLIVGLLTPDSGTILVKGMNVDQIPYKELLSLRLKVGFLFQSGALYDSMTVRENLEFPLVRNRRTLGRKEIDFAVEKVLDDVGLAQTIDRMPSELSGGQRKRIGIARTLILQPEIMLYDEPTAGLDPVTSSDINNLIKEVQLKFHTSSIVITHDLTCAKQVGDRIAILMDGKFLRPGSFNEVFENPDPRIKSFYEYNFIS